MNKRVLLDQLIGLLEEERKRLAEAALHTYEAATHEESEPEDQYDTRGLEASYLAGAQAKRVGEIEQTILAFRYLQAKSFKDSDPIGPTALVTLEHDGKKTFCFLLPQGGGLALDYEGRHIQVVTPRSPLGESLVGREVGDVALVEVGDDTKEYDILAIE